MKTLFVDFDGVLHAYGTKAMDRWGYRFHDPGLFVWVPVLERLLEGYDADVVVSSDWATFCGDDTLRHLLRGLGSRFRGYISERVDDDSRATDILNYVRKHDLTDWLALDDHGSVLEACSLEVRFVWCPPDRGITDLAAQEKVAAWLEGRDIVG